jgi:cytochrome c oxidase subunit II
MFSNASNFVEGVDTAFVVILSIILFFLVGLTAVMIYFIFKYRESKSPKATQIDGSNTLEILWTVIPLLLVMAMFYYGWIGFKPMKTKPPKDALNITTTARMWSWMFEYPNGKKTDTLYVPAGKPVNLDLISADVIHSIYIPAFRIKQDIVPGNDNFSWFIANSPGSYDLFCTEYCGRLHAYMITTVEVMPEEDFEKWLGDTAVVTATADGQKGPHPGAQIMRQYGCVACHTTDGTRLVGPSYKGLWGKEQVVIEDGKEKTVTVDEEYIRTSIYEPNAQIVKGYDKNLMLSYKGQVTEEEMQHIIDYLKTLQ